jgi:hypothetical protein
VYGSPATLGVGHNNATFLFTPNTVLVYLERLRTGRVVWAGSSDARELGHASAKAWVNAAGWYQQLQHMLLAGNLFFPVLTDNLAIKQHVTDVLRGQNDYRASNLEDAGKRVPRFIKPEEWASLQDYFIERPSIVSLTHLYKSLRGGACTVISHRIFSRGRDLRQVTGKMHCCSASVACAYHVCAAGKAMPHGPPQIYLPNVHECLLSQCQHPVSTNWDDGIDTLQPRHEAGCG